mmetsp:Transcript_23037/g.30630  ORF Transcript_23037/g.30630 Transcript_23037/m.30630 type:complete len:108 (+) Transcript_23037:110-433(+)
MQNYNYIVMSPQKKVKQEETMEHVVMDSEHERFKIEPVEVGQSGQETSNRENNRNQNARGSMTERRKSNTGGNPKRQAEIAASVDLDRRSFVTQIMSDLDRKVESIQ